MEQETLFTSSKWDILKCLESGKKSPLDLAKETNTSVANISQQLRLLELAGFVKSERISNREKGLPRILYSLAGNYSYLIVSAPGFVEKKFTNLEDRQKIILKIWMLEEKSLQYYIEKYFWTIEKHLDKLTYIAVDYTDLHDVKVLLQTESTDLKKLLKNTDIEGKSGSKKFSVSFVKDPLPTGKYSILHAHDDKKTRGLMKNE
jgi:predicted transcriptional regulator